MIEKAIAKAGYKMSEKAVSNTCMWWFYQGKIPEKVKMLRKKK